MQRAAVATYDVAEEVARLPWHHSIDFGGGVVSAGATPLAQLKATADIFFRGLLPGRSLIDVGCWDGFYSFEANQRGATRVLATDHYVWSEHVGGNRRHAFELARSCLAPTVEVREIDVFALSPAEVGTFDIVLFAGVLYHMRHPFLALETVARLSTEWLVVETHLDAENEPRPAMIFYPTTELAGDPTNWWGPNRACVEAMLTDLGFPHIEFTPTPFWPERGVFRARR